jgi:hypothetical protein
MERNEMIKSWKTTAPNKQSVLRSVASHSERSEESLLRRNKIKRDSSRRTGAENDSIPPLSRFADAPAGR